MGNQDDEAKELTVDNIPVSALFFGAKPPGGEPAGWKGPWKCEKCGRVLGGQYSHRSQYGTEEDCPGKIVPFERRRAASGLREALEALDLASRELHHGNSNPGTRAEVAFTVDKARAFLARRYGAEPGEAL